MHLSLFKLKSHVNEYNNIRKVQGSEKPSPCQQYRKRKNFNF